MKRQIKNCSTEKYKACDKNTKPLIMWGGTTITVTQ